MEVSRDGTTCTELSEKDLRLMSLEEYHDCQRCIPEVIERNPHCKEITRIWCLVSNIFHFILKKNVKLKFQFD